jgi:serine/alanine adding enzyme
VKYLNIASGLGTVYHMFIKREIDIKIDDTVWYDLITPYGYGGPVIKECKKTCRAELIKKFERMSLQSIVKKNRIVSEFIRFHPIVGNANDFKDMYHVSYIRKYSRYKFS